MNTSLVFRMLLLVGSAVSQSAVVADRAGGRGIGGPADIYAHSAMAAAATVNAYAKAAKAAAAAAENSNGVDGADKFAQAANAAAARAYACALAAVDDGLAADKYAHSAGGVANKLALETGLAAGTALKQAIQASQANN